MGEGAGLADAEAADLQQGGGAGPGEGREIARRRTGQREEGIGFQFGMVREQLDDGLVGEVGCGAVRGAQRRHEVLGQQLLRRGDERGGVQEQGRILRLVVDAAGALDRERRAGHGAAQCVHDLERGRALQGADLDDAAAAVQIDDGRAVRADRQAVAVHMVADRAHPAGRAAGDEEHLDAGPLGGGERGDGPVGDRLVVVQQRAVEVGGDQPGRNGWFGPGRRGGGISHGAIFPYPRAQACGGLRG